MQKFICIVQISFMENPGRFVALRFVVRFGGLLPWLAMLLCLAAGALMGGLGTAWGAVGVLVIAAIAGGITRLAVEVVDLVAETLLPR
jgi:hypothetical protein